MTLEELKIRAEKAGFKYAYNEFKDNTEPPHLIAHEVNTENYSADNRVFLKRTKIQLELTTNKKDLELEKKIENKILYDIYWDNQEAYIETEKVFNMSYFFEI